MDIGNLYNIRPRAMGAQYDVRAKSAAQAWAKFVAQAFRTLPIKPDRNDYIVNIVRNERGQPV